MPDIALQPIPVLCDGGSHEGRLVLFGEDLVAVLVWVTDRETRGGEPHAEGWFLEAGFGPCGSLMTITPPVFPNLDDALEWVRERLDARLSSQ